MKPFVSQPTATELAEEQTIRLTSSRYARSNWVPWGFRYPLRFNKNGEAFVLESHFDAWLGQDLADIMGMTVTRMTCGDGSTRAVARDQVVTATTQTVSDDQQV
jgi:hypothetical protein